MEKEGKRVYIREMKRKVKSERKTNREEERWRDGGGETSCNRRRQSGRERQRIF